MTIKDLESQDRDGKKVALPTVEQGAMELRVQDAGTKNKQGFRLIQELRWVLIAGL